MTVLPLLAQAAATDPGWLDSLGRFIAFGGLAMLVIWYLAKMQAEERRANRELSDRLVEQAEKMLPLLERTAVALEQATSELRSRR